MRLAASLVLVGACAAPAVDSGVDSEATDAKTKAPAAKNGEGRMDAKLLAIPTLIRSRTARVVLSSRWKGSVKLAGIRTEKTTPDQWLARGSAEFVLRELRIEATDEINVTFLDNHDDFVLFAKNVKLYKRKKDHIVDRQENVQAITIANGQVSVLSQGGVGR